MYGSVVEYLAARGYVSVEEWARDSDYRRVSGESGDFWVDNDGYVVNIDRCIADAIDEVNSALENARIVWVGGVEVAVAFSDSEAEGIASEWRSQGFDDVTVEGSR